MKSVLKIFDKKQSRQFVVNSIENKKKSIFYGVRAHVVVNVNSSMDDFHIRILESNKILVKMNQYLPTNEGSKK